MKYNTNYFTISLFLFLFCLGCENKKEINKNDYSPQPQKNKTIIDCISEEFSKEIPRGIDSDIKLYKEGLTYEQQEEFVKAIEKFIEIGHTSTIEGDWEIAIAAKLHLALCYLRLNDKKKAIDLLENIISTPNVSVQPDKMKTYFRIGEIDFKYRECAEKILNDLGIALPKVYIKLLQNIEPQVRNVAAERLTVLKDTSAIEPMKKLLHDYDGVAWSYAKDKSVDTIYYLVDSAKKYFKTITDSDSK